MYSVKAHVDCDWSSPDLPDGGVQSEGGLCRDDGQVVVAVVVDKVTHTLECAVSGPEYRLYERIVHNRA